MTSELFRQEAIDALSRSNLGEPRLSAPPGLTICALSIIVLVLASAWYVGNHDYARRYPVAGTFDANHAKQVIARQIGELAELTVSEGDVVERGEYLGRIATGSTDAVDSRVIAGIHDQINALHRIFSSTQERHVHEKDLLADRRSRILQLLKLTARDISLQRSKVDKLEQQFREISRLRDQRYISNIDWLNFETSLISERQNLNQHRQAGVRLRQELTEADNRIRDQNHEYTQTMSRLKIQLADLEGRLVQQEENRCQQLLAPASGRITRVDLTPGAPVLPGMPVLHISGDVPAYSGSLRIPSYAAGFVRVGDHLDLDVDAFPSQRHGRISAKIVHLSDHPIAQEDGRDAYVARLQVDAGSLRRNDTGRYLPGMNFRTYVRVENRTIFNWITAPLLKVLNLS